MKKSKEELIEIKVIAFVKYLAHHFCQMLFFGTI